MSIGERLGAQASPGPEPPDRSNRSSLGSVAARLSPDTWCVIAIGAAVLLANVLYVLGVFDANPLGPRSGLDVVTKPGLIHGLPTIDPNNGFVSQALGHRAALDALHLHLPWWTPFEGTGAPLAAEMQSAALFPPTLLTAFSGGQLYEHMLLEFLAGASTYLLLRRLSLARVACLAAAIAFALNGTFAWFAHAPVNPVAFLPLLVLGIEFAYDASLNGRRGGWWLIALSGALSVYGGFPETAYIDSLLAAAWFAWRCWSAGQTAWRPFFVKGLTGAAVGTLLTAPLLIPAVSYVHNGDLGIHAGAAGDLSIPHQGLTMLLLPYVFGPIFDYNNPTGLVFGIWGSVGGYLTVSLVLLALFGLLSGKRRALKLILLGWIMLAVARIYAFPPGLSDVLGILPGMSRVAFYRYAFPSLEFAVIVLAALGVDDLVSARAVRRRMALAAGVSLGLTFIAIVAAVPIDHQLGPGHKLYSHVSAVWAVGIILCVAAVARLKSARWRTRLITALVALDTAALFVAPQLSAPRKMSIDLQPVAFLQRHLGIQRFFTFGPLAPNYGSYFGISELDMNDLPVPSVFSRFVHTRLDPYTLPHRFIGNNSGGRPATVPSSLTELLANLKNFRNAGVTYVLTLAGHPLPQSHGALRLVLRTPTTWIYYLSGASPYFTTSEPRCQVNAQGREAVRLSCPRPTTLVRRETSFPGWTASIDGHKAGLGTADGIFQTVHVPDGTHRVTFSYAPPAEALSTVAFLVGCVWLVIGSLPQWRRAPPMWLKGARRN